MTSSCTARRFQLTCSCVPISRREERALHFQEGEPPDQQGHVVPTGRYLPMQMVFPSPETGITDRLGPEASITVRTGFDTREVRPPRQG